MKYPIVLLNDQLHEKSTITEVEDVKTLVDDLLETLNGTTGCGLAAPQVGLSYRIFVTNYVSPYLKEFKGVCIDPEIIEHSETTVNELEGCLSLPGLQERVERWEWVKVRYKDTDDQVHEDKFEGLLSRIAQHEIDHLDGIVFIDHLPKVRIKKLRHDIEDLINRKHIVVKYPYR